MDHRRERLAHPMPLHTFLHPHTCPPNNETVVHCSCQPVDRSVPPHQGDGAAHQLFPQQEGQAVHEGLHSAHGHLWSDALCGLPEPPTFSPHHGYMTFPLCSLPQMMQMRRWPWGRAAQAVPGGP
jgi:hypothetical protein